MAVGQGMAEKNLDNLEKGDTSAVCQEKDLSKQVQSGICEPEISSEAVCKQCDKFACKKCAHMHTEMSAVFEAHKMGPIEQLQKIKGEEPKKLVPTNQAAKSKCQAHDELLKSFCFDCNELICHDCTKDHKDHHIEFICVVADKKKIEFIQSLKPLREVEISLSQALEKMCNTEDEVKAQGESMANTIESSFDQLQKILEERKQQLLKEAKMRVMGKIKNLTVQKKNYSTVSTSVRRVINYTEQCLRLCSDREIVSMHTEISQQIQDEIEKHSKPENKLEPVEEADLGVEMRYTEDLQQLCQKTKITPPAVFTMTNMPNTAEVNKVTTIEVVNTNKKATECEPNLECQITCVSTGAAVKPKIKSKTPDRYQIFYTPGVSGRHELSVSAYGQPVLGSPFTIIAYISPAHIGKPTKVWVGVTRPHSIAANSVGEIIVAEFNKDVAVWDNDGNLLRRIKPSQHKISRLRSVAVDNEDNIYFIGENSNIIGKATRNCNTILVRDIHVKQVKGPGYVDIAILGEEVMVTEYYNDGYIMVYDRELNYVRQITGRNKTRLRAFYPDCHGNLYISDNNNTIQVLSKMGDFICSFSCDRNGVQQLKDPVMVHVYGQYVYVADHRLMKTVVFTTKGEYVTTFGCYGGICVNQDGVLYIGDRQNNKVTCYWP